MKEKLTSIRLQSVIDINQLDVELWRPILRFGRKKSGEFDFPIVFKEYKYAKETYSELQKLIGKTLDEVKKEVSEIIYEKFKKYHYLNTDFDKHKNK